MASDAVHVVAFPLVLPGHINPLLHLCSKLLTFGAFRITFINNIENHKRMFSCRDPVTRDGIHFVAVSDGLPEKGPNAQHPVGMEGLEEVIKSTAGMQPGVEELLESMLAEGDSIKGIVSDTLVHWTQDTANKFKLVRVAFSTTSATFDLVTLHMKRFRAEGFVPVNERTPGDRLIEFIPGMPNFSPYDLCLMWYDEHPVIDFFIRPYERLFEADWILSGTFQEMEPDKISVFHDHYGFKNYLPVGPFLPDEHISGDHRDPETYSSIDPEQVRCMQWLDSRPNSSVLYVAFGSIAVMPVEQFHELVLALDCCAKKNMNVIWAV